MLIIIYILYNTTSILTIFLRKIKVYLLSSIIACKFIDYLRKNISLIVKEKRKKLCVNTQKKEKRKSVNGVEMLKVRL